MIIIHDSRLPASYREGLNKLVPGVRCFALNMAERGTVYASILSHPDIYFFQIAPDTLVHAPNVPETFLTEMEKTGVKLIRGKNAPTGVYPDTCLYNAVLAGTRMFHNLRYTDPVILNEAERRGLRPVDVRQGYTRCSTFVVDDNAILTQDCGTAEAAGKEGIEVLLISGGSVTLPGESSGFLGGAAGWMDGNALLLGDLERHEDAAIINRFLKKHGMGLRGIKDAEIYDAGGLFMLEPAY